MDLSTQYMGLTLENPIVPGASPLTSDLSAIRRLEDTGAAAVVLHSLFEEQATQESRQLDHYLSYASEMSSEALSYFPEPDRYQLDPDNYLELIRKSKEAVSIPVIASLNGVSASGWTDYAREMQAAGADALELNIYYIPTDPLLSSAQVEQMYVDVLRSVTRSVTIPVAVKLGPFFSSTAYMVRRLSEVGARSVVLFNRFYQPDIDLEKLEVVPHLVLSSASELRLPLRWVAILYGRIPTDFAVTSGVHTHEDVIKAVMAGASAVQMVSALLRHGPTYLEEVLKGMTQWMEQKEYESVAQMRGSMSQRNIAEPAAFERANYMKVLQSY